MDDEVTSPLKPVEPATTGIDKGEPTTRKNLNLVLSENAGMEQQPNIQQIVVKGAIGQNLEQSAVGTEGAPASTLLVDTPPLPQVYVPPRELKKSKKAGSPTEHSQMALLAGSERGHRQAQ